MLAAALLLVTLHAPALASSKVDSTNITPLLVSGLSQYSPNLMVDAMGNPSGVMWDILATAARRIGMRLQYIEYPWKRALLELEKGNIDIICGAYWTQGRAKKFDYSPAVALDQARLFVRKPFPVSSIADLKGKRGDMLLGASFGEAFDRAKSELNLTAINDKKNALFRLQRGFSDYFICAYDSCIYYIHQLNLGDSITTLPFVLSKNRVYYAYSKASIKKGWQKKLNGELQRMLNNGDVDRIRHMYMNR